MEHVQGFQLCTHNVQERINVIEDDSDNRRKSWNNNLHTDTAERTLKFHINNNSSQYDLCSVSYTQQSHIIGHLFSSKNNEKLPLYRTIKKEPFECNFCSKSFS